MPPISSISDSGVAMETNLNVTSLCLLNMTALQNSTLGDGKAPIPKEAFFYIVTVIVFYATSIVLLMIKYSRRDDEEKMLSYQYAEFVKREKFQDPKYKNSLALVKTKELLASLQNDCPVIVVTGCSDQVRGSTQSLAYPACGDVTPDDGYATSNDVTVNSLQSVVTQ